MRWLLLWHVLLVSHHTRGRWHFDSIFCRTCARRSSGKYGQAVAEGNEIDIMAKYFLSENVTFRWWISAINKQNVTQAKSHIEKLLLCDGNYVKRMTPHVQKVIKIIMRTVLDRMLSEVSHEKCFRLTHTNPLQNWHDLFEVRTKTYYKSGRNDGVSISTVLRLRYLSVSA